MRRMITTKLLDWAKKLFNNIQADGNKTEVGGDLEIDGQIKVNNGNQYLHYVILEQANTFRASFIILNDKETAYAGSTGRTELYNFLMSLAVKKGDTFRITTTGAYVIGSSAAIVSHMDCRSDSLLIYGLTSTGASATGFRLDNINPTLFDDVVKIM